MISVREAAEIRGYHAHVYFDRATRERALALREAIASRSRWRSCDVAFIHRYLEAKRS